MAQPSKQAKARYRERNREQLRAWNREYQAKKREDPDYAEWQRERIRQLTRDNPAYLSEIRRRSYAKHAEKRRAEQTERRQIARMAIYERDGGRCHLCSRVVSRADFHIDHLIPVSKGGPSTSDNLALAHPFCNQTRGAGRLPAQLRLVG